MRGAVVLGGQDVQEGYCCGGGEENNHFRNGALKEESSRDKLMRYEAGVLLNMSILQHQNAFKFE
jgi:hypothetical protein